MTEEQVIKLFETCSNWGRWGEDDELGTVNYITEEKRRAAARLVRRGRCIGLGKVGGGGGIAASPSSVNHRMLYLEPESPAIIDTVDIAPHGWETTHVDALGHFSFNGTLYNGRRTRDVVDRFGLRELSVARFAEGIFTRGVLLDVAGCCGVKALDVGYEVMPVDLEAAEERVGVEVGTGDAVFVRVGVGARGGVSPVPALREAGLSPESVQWLHDREVAVYSGDCQEKRPSGFARVPEPLHQIGLVSMGLCLLDVPDMEALLKVAEEECTCEFLLAVAPLPLAAATGSAVNPLCIF